MSLFYTARFAFAAYLPESNHYIHAINGQPSSRLRRPLRVKACMEMCHETL